ncbi:MAG TPA: TatD family hydrolase [Candidatus Hypogeohydataceae bacterium YC41]
MLLVDTHTHLDMPEYEGDLPEVIERARAQGVEYLLVVGTDLASSRKALSLAQANKGLYASVGVHPHGASNVTDKEWEELKGLVHSPKVVAVGETGLDYHHLFSPKESQQAVFRRHIELALEAHFPLIIHNREATADCLSTLKEYSARSPRGVFHCFGGSKETARECINMGFYISIGGPVTFPNAHRLREVVKSIPVERLLLETDCPYLSPQPQRGKRNEPAYIKYLLPVLAQLYNLTEEDIARITTFNAFQLFGMGTNRQEGKIAYTIRNSLYLNITNRCSNTCSFCPRLEKPYVKGYYLGLKKEPTVEAVLEAVGDNIGRYDEVVFCGYGEPTERLDILKEVANILKEKGARKIRLNTNGQGDLINGRPICAELAGLVDSVYISLNTPSADEYKELCSPGFEDMAYPALLAFTRQAKDSIPEVTLSVVDVPGLDVETCKEIARELGVNFRVRRYNDLG